jgi:tetratricopeptide (TPR) repeat protein
MPSQSNRSSTFEGCPASIAAEYEARLLERPNDAKLRHALARLFEDLDRSRDLIDLLKHPSVAQLALTKRMLIKAHIRLQEFVAAKSYISELLAGSPDDAKLRQWESLCDEKMSARPAVIGRRPALDHSLTGIGEQHEVFRYVNDAIAANIADFECHRWLAYYRFDRHDWTAALQSALNALAIRPKYPSTCLLLARALIYLGRLPEALDQLEVLSSLNVKTTKVLQLKGDIFVRLGRVDEAISVYEAARRQDPRQPLIAQKLSYALLLKGDIGGFHRFHEIRREVGSFVSNNKERPYRDWNGDISIEGKLLVWCEFGLGVGQNILHLTFLNSLVALGMGVVVEVDRRLAEICRRSFPDLTIVADNEVLPTGISHHTPVGSLSRWFKAELEAFSSMQPYLVPDVRALAAQRQRLLAAAGEQDFLIGISWSSSNAMAGHIKSVELDQLLATVDLPGVTLVNLQYGDHAEAVALAQTGTGRRIIDSGVDNNNDLDGLAAVIAAMDLVVCIGHTTAHLAGAIGTPSFVLLPAAPFPHWLARGEQCIWYPATTLFRQAIVDDGWSGVLAQVQRATDEFTTAYDPNDWLETTLVRGLRPFSHDPVRNAYEVIRDAVPAFVAQGAHRSALALINRLPEDGLSRDLQIHRAELLASLGHWERARSVYVSLTSKGNGGPEIDKRIAALSLQAYDLEFALPVARQVAVEDAAYRVTVANILYHLQRYGEAMAELRAASLEATNLPGLGTLLGTLLIATGQAERAEAYLAGQARVDDQTAEYTLLGRSIWMQGRRMEALAIYEKVVSLRPNDPEANFFRTQARLDLGLITRKPLPKLKGGTPEVAPEDTVIFCVADNAYFWEHVLVLLGSLGHHDPDSACHVHVINPDVGVASAVDAVREILPNLRLSYSYEYIDLTECSEAHVRTYYASVRFVRLAELIVQSPASYLCLDADCIVKGDITSAISRFSTCDVGIRRRFSEHTHMTVAAGALLVRPTPAARDFIEQVSARIRSTLEAGDAVWFLDQIVLGWVLREMEGGDLNAKQLDMSFIDWFFQDDSLVWTGKGKRKASDTKYTDALSKYRYLQEARVPRSLRAEATELIDAPGIPGPLLADGL